MAGKLETRFNVLITGNGGREDAYLWKTRKSPLVKDVFVASGNGGTERWGKNVDLSSTDIDGLVSFVKNPHNNIGLVILGNDTSVAAGLTNALNEEKFKNVFGATKEAGIIESSKIEAVKLMRTKGIPHPDSDFYYSPNDAFAAVRKPDWNKTVLKADGLCLGKGVSLANSVAEAEEFIRKVMIEKVFGDSGNAILMQKREKGKEASVFAFCDGEIAIPIPVIPHDYKPVFDNNEGPNTGGMGAFTMAQDYLVSAEELKWIHKYILQPTIDALRENGHPYKGILYAGLIKTKGGFKVLEFNARGGDPETQVMLPRLKSDLVQIAFACTSGNLKKSQILWTPDATVGVVLTSGGYPEHYKTGEIIHGLENIDCPNIIVFHAGTKKEGNRTLTEGGRVLTVVGLDDSNLERARQKAYGVIGQDGIHFKNMHYRKDIADL